MRLTASLCALTLILCGSAAAQSSVSVGNASGVLGATVDVPTTLTTTTDVYGWSWGVCHDASVIEVLDVAVGADASSLNGGSGPDFYTTQLFPGEGWSVGVIVSFLFNDVLSPGSDLEMDVASYELLADGSSLICFCDGLQPGADPVVTLVVIGEDGAAEVPTQDCGSVTSGMRYTFAMADATVTYDPAVGAASFVVSPTIEEDPMAPGFPVETSGFSVAASHNGSLLTVAQVDPAPLLADLDGGNGPAFFAPAILPDGYTVGVVYDFFGIILIPFASASEVIDVTYDSVPQALLGNVDGATTVITFDDSLGNPPSPNLVVIASGAFFSPLFDDAVVDFVPGVGAQTFVRGDFDASGGLGLPDGIGLLNFLFVPGSAGPVCEDAADVDDTGGMGLPDGIAVLNYLFVPGSNPPAAPHPDCGIDPTDDGLGCDQFAACP